MHKVNAVGQFCLFNPACFLPSSECELFRFFFLYPRFNVFRTPRTLPLFLICFFFYSFIFSAPFSSTIITMLTMFPSISYASSNADIFVNLFSDFHQVLHIPLLIMTYLWYELYLLNKSTNPHNFTNSPRLTFVFRLRGHTSHEIFNWDWYSNDYDWSWFSKPRGRMRNEIDI